MCTPQCIFDKLGGLAFDEAVKQGKYVVHYAKNLENLKDEMKHLDDRRECIRKQVCEAIDSGKEIMPDVKTWQTEADGLKNDVDKLMEESTAMGNMLCIACSCPNIKWRYRLSKQAEQKIQDVKELTKKGHFEEIAHRRPPPPELEALSKNYVNFDSRRPIFNKIVHALEESSVNMIGVYGPGGVGKTSLALEVAEKMRRDGTFKQVSRATIPKGLTVEEIQSQLADGLNFKFDPNTDKMGSRAIQLWHKLTNGEKYLIILDDIWEKLDIMAIGIPITDVNKKCKVLLTSRDKDLLLIKMQVDSFAIEELPKAEAWDLFQKKVGNSFESNPEIDFIAHALCKRCQGLPVAINAIGAALEGKLVHVWKDALVKLERYELMDIEGIDPSVWASLRLSYDFLSPNAKSCFLLCCLFREDAEIQISDLTRHCLARRLLSRNPRTLEEVRNSVCTVIDALKSASLLLDGSDNNFVRIHDIIREVGISIAREEKAFYVELGALHWPENPIDRPPYSAISLISGRIEALPTKLTCPKLHTLMFENSKLLDLEVPDEFFSEMTQLSVLVLTGMRMQQLPSSFGKLAKLRMLFLIECHLADISILGDLNKELEVLRLQGSIIKSSSPISGQLTSLRVLDLEKCKLKYLFSPTTARGLVHLEQLQVSSCEIMEGIVRIEGDGNEHAGEMKFAKLKQLKLENLPNLISFYAKKEKTQTTMGSSSTNAQPLFNETVIFPLLEVLSLQNLDNITEIWDKKSVAVVEDQGSFCQLMDLNVNQCAQLTHVFPSKMHALLKNLKNLSVSYCETMKGIVEFEGDRDEDGLKNELCFSKLSTLHLDNLRNLVSFCTELRTAGTTNGNATILAQPLFNEKVAFPSLEDLTIHKVPNITEIWDKKSLPESEKETQSFWRLRHIYIGYCNQLVYVLPCYMLSQLQINLQRLLIWQCDEVEVIVSKELKEKEATENEIIVFHQLKDVTFSDLHKLKSFYTGTELLFSDKVAFPSLENLDICNLPKIKEIWPYKQPLPEPGKEAKSFCKLSYILVMGCEQLVYVFPFYILRQLQHLEKLEITYCENMEVIVSAELKEEEVIHNDIIVFPQLKTVRLRRLPNLKRICSETQLFFSDKVGFPSLENLHIKGLPKIKEIWPYKQPLPEPGKEAESFCKLSDISVAGCEQLVYVFPFYILRQLQHLELLMISNCEKLEVIVSAELKEEEVIHNDIVFPQLKTVELWGLSNLKRICSETQLYLSDKDAFPVLENIQIYDRNLKFLRNGTSTKEVSLEECGTSGKEGDYDQESDYGEEGDYVEEGDYGEEGAMAKKECGTSGKENDHNGEED